MGSSPSGILCYGVRIESGAELPWHDDKFEDDHEAWWRHITGFVHTVDSPYTDQDEYKPGYKKGDPRIDEFYKERREWEKMHPFPFDLIWIGYIHEPSYILAVEGSKLSAQWDECIQITPDMIQFRENDLVEFCNAHSIPIVGEPAWWLTSNYG